MTTQKRLHWIDPHSPPAAFPDIDTALPEPEGLLAMGGDLSEERLLAAYSRAIFPWYSEGQPILWWSPDPRCVIRPERFHASRSLRRQAKIPQLEITFNEAFESVMRACAEPRVGQDGTWITDDMLQAYVKLHARGWAHSVEIWDRDSLVGGLYGLSIGSVFFGESMFSKASGGSKFALWALNRVLQARGFALLDCQVESPHLLTLGAERMQRQDFRRVLAEQCKSRQPLGQLPNQRIPTSALLQESAAALQ